VLLEVIMSASNVESEAATTQPSAAAEAPMHPTAAAKAAASEEDTEVARQ